LHDDYLQAALESVRAAAVSGESEQMEAAASELQRVWSTLGPDILAGSSTYPVSECLVEKCRHTAILASAAADFYSGMSAVVRMQLQGYGLTANAAQPQPGCRFALEG
jgi:hypothetical protein